MKVMTIAEAQAAFDQVLGSVAEDSIVLKRGERDVAAVISIADYKKLRRFMVEELLALCERVGREAESRGLSEEKLAEILRDDA